MINNFHASLRFYLNCILVLTNYLSHPLTYNNVTMIDDLFWKKIITCLYELKRPTEAAITGQLVTQMFEVLPHIYEILCSHECEDSTSDYFHLIGDLAIFEAMSAAYGRQAFGRRQFQLVSCAFLSTTGKNTFLDRTGAYSSISWKFSQIHSHA